MRAENNFLNHFNEKKWDFLFIEGSPLGNTGFLLNFIKNVILFEKNKNNILDQVLDEIVNILYIRDVEIRDESSLKNLKTIEDLSFIETVFNEEAIDPLNIIRLLKNRKYNYLVLDLSKKESIPRDNSFFNVLKFCKENRIKIIVSTTENTMQKNYYDYFKSDIILNIQSHILDNVYNISIDEKNLNKNKVFTMLIK